MSGPEIVVEHLTVREPRVKKVDDLSFRAPAGRVTALLGPANAGKTSVLRVLAGQIRAASGEIRYSETPSRIGTVLMQRPPWPEWGRPGYEFLRARSREKGLPDRRVDEVLDRIGFAEQAGRKVKNYSDGTRYGLQIAEALLDDPQVLLLDEPQGPLAPAEIEWLAGVLRKLERTVVMAADDPDEARPIADHLVIIRAGRLVRQGPVADAGPER